jgi:hypothetical protein
VRTHTTAASTANALATNAAFTVDAAPLTCLLAGFDRWASPDKNWGVWPEGTEPSPLRQLRRDSCADIEQDSGRSPDTAP